uniref:CARD domain-containing protein n=1 Tax=Branchiostoma floridae TaxID=7739 RepID=C3YYP0_BRAFL|eukprot:XP_002598668.1 hypothetical protein BRAFLDRAFT_67069 [Branchiostoma floridae]
MYKVKDLSRLITRNYVTLTKQLQAKAVIPHLIQEGILLREHREEILKCTTSQDMAQELLDKVMARGNCTDRLFVDVLRRSGHGHLADTLEGPNSKVARTEGIRDMTDSQLDELRSRLQKVYREEAERHEGDTSLEGLTVHEMDHDNSRMSIGMRAGIDLVSWLQAWRSSFVKEEAGRQVGTAFTADWVGDKKVTSDFKQVYKLKLNKVRKNQTIIGAIFDQLLHDPNYEPSFSKKSLWNYMEQTQEKILFVLEGLDRLNPFTSPEILQLIDKKLLPRATVIVTVAEANGA